MPDLEPKLTRRPKRRSANRVRDRRPRAAGRIAIVLSAAPRLAGRVIAKALVDARVAACVNIVPGVESVFRWKGRIERAGEVLLVIKTTSASVRACRKVLTRVHPYEVPEILVVRTAEASLAYTRWVQASTV